MSVTPLDFQKFVGTTADEQRWQICNAVLESGGGGGTTTNSNVAVASDGTTRAPLKLDSNGRLIVDIGSSVQIDQVLVDLTAVESKQDTSNALLTTIQADLAGSTPAGANTIGYVNIKGYDDNNDQYLDIVVDPNGFLYANIQSPLPAGTNFIGSVNPDSTGTGSVTSSTPLVVTVTNFGTLAFQSNAVATGNVTIEASVDGTTYTATTYTALTSGNTSSTFNAATATIGQIDLSGFKNIRFRSNTITSGTVGITYNLSKNVSNVMLDNPLPTGTNTIGAVNIASSQTIAVTQATASNLNATITGTVTANAGTNLSTSNLDVALSTRLKPADTLAGVTAVGSITNALPAGTNTIGAVTVTGVATAANQATEITSLASIATNTAKVAGFSIPTFDTKTFTYVSGTTNIQTVVYSLSGTTVATLTFNYTSGNLTSIVKS